MTVTTEISISGKMSSGIDRTAGNAEKQDQQGQYVKV